MPAITPTPTPECTLRYVIVSVSTLLATGVGALATGVLTLGVAGVIGVNGALVRWVPCGEDALLSEGDSDSSFGGETRQGLTLPFVWCRVRWVCGGPGVLKEPTVESLPPLLTLDSFGGGFWDCVFFSNKAEVSCEACLFFGAKSIL